MATIDVRIDGADDVGLQVAKLMSALRVAGECANDVQMAVNRIRFFAGGVEIDEEPGAKAVWVVSDHLVRGIHDTREGAEATKKLLESAEPKSRLSRFDVSRFIVEKWEVGN